MRTSLQPEFPDNREINREFLNFGPISAILVSNRPANSITFRQIPYAAEQGIFWGNREFLRRNREFRGSTAMIVVRPITSGFLLSLTSGICSNPLRYSTKRGSPRPNAQDTPEDQIPRQESSLAPGSLRPPAMHSIPAPAVRARAVVSLESTKVIWNLRRARPMGRAPGASPGGEYVGSG
jgi:hypothetical protein